MNIENLEKYHEAAKMIETDGVDAYYSVSKRFGEDIANALIVAHIRRGLGSMDSFPARDGIVEETNRLLAEAGTVETVEPTRGIMFVHWDCNGVEGSMILE